MALTFCALLISANLSLVVYADDPPAPAAPPADTRACAEVTPAKTTRLETLKTKYQSLGLKLKNLPIRDDTKPTLARPNNLLNANGWEESNDNERNQYCTAIQYLQEYINDAYLNRIADCSAQGLSSEAKRAINDARCTSLVCNAITNNNQYYKNSAEANALRRANSQSCSVDGVPQAKCYLKLPNYINHCNECKSLIDQHIQLVSRGVDSDIYLQADLNGSTVDCERYLTVSSCQTAFDCSNDGKPTLQTYEGRIPFATEFFDIADPQTGLGAGEGTQFRADAEGGPIVNTINTLANFLARMIATLSLLIFVIGSFILITANGDENQINRGKDAIKYSILGIVIVMLAYIIVVLIQSIFF